MRELRKRGFVDEDTMRFIPNPVLRGIHIQGAVPCLGRIVVDVDKFLKILEGQDDDALVQTRMYSYNVFFRRGHNILRYDNQHPHDLYPNHHDEHHKHEFNWRTGEPLSEIPRWIGEGNWPTLGEVITEVEKWYWENHHQLPHAGEFPELDVRS